MPVWYVANVSEMWSYKETSGFLGVLPQNESIINRVQYVCIAVRSHSRISACILCVCCFDNAPQRYLGTHNWSSTAGLLLWVPGLMERHSHSGTLVFKAAHKQVKKFEVTNSFQMQITRNTQGSVHVRSMTWLWATVNGRSHRDTRRQSSGKVLVQFTQI